MADALKQWYVQGLQALTSANELGRKGADEGSYEAKNDEVASLAESSAAMQARHAETIARLLKDAGGEPTGKDNPAMKGIYQAINEMIDGADEQVKDAAALAGAQLAFHYYIAAYGSLAADARHVGDDDAAAQIATLGDEVAAQDRKYTDCAETLANRQAADA